MTFEDDLLALEQKVLTDAAGNFLVAVAELRTMLAVSDSGIVAKLARLAIPRIEQIAKAGVVDAFAAGADWALGSLVHTGDNAVDSTTVLKATHAADSPPVGLSTPLDGLDDLVGTSKSTALLLVRNGADIDAALAPVFHAATIVRSTVVTQLNAASNTASRTVGEAVGSPMVWEAERDACVYCLALAGEVVDTPGDLFPPADLYDAHGATARVTVQQPPLHPHCRCRLAILNSPDYAESLKREAQRSILRGFSLQSESNGVRVRAAARLLATDPVAPKSVKEYAAKAVKAGGFPRTRKVPDGDPRLVIK